MKSRTILTAVIAFVIGFFAHWAASRLIYPTVAKKARLAWHWKMVNEYRAHLSNPSNYEEYPSGLSGTIQPYDPMPSLAALVAAGQLEHADLILPLVPSRNETNRYWMQFVSDHHEAIIFASGNTQYTYYQPSGEPPLHLKLWFKPNARADVQRLIKELEILSATLDQ